MFSDPLIIIAILVAFSLGGILKGATGAGAPIITIPVIAAFYDVRIAVIIMVIPNLLTNIGQLYHCLLYTSPSPRDMRRSRMPSSA